MFQTIVIGLDGSDGAKKAIPFATELARRDDAKLVIAHVEEYTIGKGGGPIHVDEDELRAELDELAKGLTDDGVDTSVEVETIRIGGPAHGIDDIAKRVGADLIVVGARGHTALSNLLLLGSVAERLLAIATQPVFVVPEAARPAEPSNTAASAAASH
jgi:nucleotide-binding universal stress UspA family protein